MNLGMLLGNVGAMGTYMVSDNPTTQLACLGTTTALSSIMGVTLTAAIGGQYSTHKDHNSCSVLSEINIFTPLSFGLIIVSYWDGGKMYSSDNLLTCFIFCIYAFDPMLLMIYYTLYRSWHACGDHRTEQLLWLGTVCWGLHVEQQSDDHCRCPDWFFWSYPLLHHVCGKYGCIKIKMDPAICDLYEPKNKTV